jgi:FAD dependent oxidoreductase
MDRRKFINASALTGAGLIAGSYLKGNDSATGAGESGKSNGTQAKQMIDLPATKIPVVLEADVVVIGGGPAGFGAAMRSARNGVSTILIERWAIPGGAATSGYMCVTGQGSSFPLHSEWVEGLRKEGWLFDAWKAYPQLENNVLVHQSGRNSFYPDDGAYVMTQMMEKANVQMLFRTSFVDTVLKRNSSGQDSIVAAVIENASGRQAVKGKIFIDSTGVADVVARSGAPYISPGNSKGQPVPPSVMYRVSGVDFAKLFEYQKTDPALWTAIAKARQAGDIPEGLYQDYQFEVGGGWGGYRGTPQLNMCAIRGNGEMLIWGYPPNQWALNLAENGLQASKGEIGMRRLNILEVKFLKKYIPGFENAYLSGMAPYFAIREGRHPQGEYVLSWDDIVNQRKFPDAVLRQSSGDTSDFGEDMLRHPNEKGEMVWKKPPRKDRRNFRFDIPYRALLPKKIDNLILAGECLSSTYEWFYSRRLIPWCMRTGEVAATAATMAVKQGIPAKDVKWTSGYYSDPIS